MPPLKIDSANLKDASLIKQIECPSVAKIHYNTEMPSFITPVSKNSSLRYVFGEAIPNALGYLNYNFTGLGSNDGGFVEKTGFGGTYAKSNRVLGYNYFYNTGTKCDSRSVDTCKGKDRFMYIRNYPAKLNPKGTVTFAMFEDIVDLNPLPMIKSMLEKPGMNSKCVMSPSLPVGSSIEPNSARQYSSEAAFVKHYNECAPECKRKHSAIAAVENCKKACFRGYWKEKRCISTVEDPPDIETFRSHVGGDGANDRQRRFDAALLVGVAVLVLVSLLWWHLSP